MGRVQRGFRRFVATGVLLLIAFPVCAQPRAVADFIRAVDGDSAKVYAMTAPTEYFGSRVAVFANATDSVFVWFNPDASFGGLYGTYLGFAYVGSFGAYRGRTSIRTLSRTSAEYRMWMEAMISSLDSMRPDSLPGRGEVGNYSFSWTMP